MGWREGVGGGRRRGGGEGEGVGGGEGGGEGGGGAASGGASVAPPSTAARRRYARSLGPRAWCGTGARGRRSDYAGHGPRSTSRQPWPTPSAFPTTSMNASASPTTSAPSGSSWSKR